MLLKRYGVVFTVKELASRTSNPGAYVISPLEETPRILEEDDG